MEKIFDFLGKVWKFVASLTVFCCFVIAPIIKYCTKDVSPYKSTPVERSVDYSSGNSENSSSHSSDNDYYIPSNNYGGNGYGSYNGSYGGSSYDNNTNSSGYSKPERVWRECSLCNGKGTIIRDSSTPTYGEDRQVYCSECGRSYWASTGHSHITCPTCHGRKGFWSE